jgi:hydroxypyruvate isomerase
LPLLDRPAAAASAGFDAVEFWWPFATPTPAAAEVDEFVAAIRDAGVQLVGLNFFAGDMPGGDRGVLSIPDRSAEFVANVPVAIDIADRLGCRALNALYGNRVEGVTPSEQDTLAEQNLRLAARAAAEIGAVVLVEPISGAPRYPLRTAADVLAVLDRVGEPNVRLLADLYHLTVNGDDLDAVIAAHTGRIGHVQIADAPGRHEPGTGSLDIHAHLSQLAANGYTGHLGLEYQPSGASADSFGWLRAAKETS